VGDNLGNGIFIPIENKHNIVTLFLFGGNLNLVGNTGSSGPVDRLLDERNRVFKDIGESSS